MREDRISVDVYVLAVAGGVLIGAAPNSAASAFVFVAVVAAALRVELDRALAVVALGALALGVATLMYNNSGVGLLAYTLGFAAAALAGSNSRQSVQRAEQAELLVAQTQRSQEEHVRAARLEESARIAREIHDVLAHALAGLTIQLEATSALLEQGADREAILARVQRAHALAREGLQETRRAVGALREDGTPAAAAVEAVSARAAIEALVEEYRTGTDAAAELTIDGDPARLAGPTGQTVQRIVQEALTNVRKHAPGAAVSVAVHAGELPEEDVVLRVDDRPISNGHPARTREPRRQRRGLRPAGHARAGAVAGRNTRRGRGSRRVAGRAATAAARCGYAFDFGDAARRGDPMNGPVRVMVVDDQALVREGLMTLLETAPDIKPVVAASDGEEAVELCARHRPDVVLMDLRMPKLDGVEATRRIRAAQPDTEVVVLTTHADEASILDALQAGARGYLTKDAGIAEISRAVHAAANHQALLDPVVHSRLLAAMSSGPRPAPAPATLPDDLTPREAEVLSLIARGLSNAEIAAALVVSQATVKTHINHVFAKIGARDRAQAVHYAYTHGLAD